jgi:hypothetical protein
MAQHGMLLAGELTTSTREQLRLKWFSLLYKHSGNPQGYVTLNLSIEKTMAKGI